MVSTNISVEEKQVDEIIQKLLSNAGEDDFAFHTDSRADYELLLQAANSNLFPELLTITRKGLRLNKRLVHSPLSMAQA